jgi:hypothetical protein
MGARQLPQKRIEGKRQSAEPLIENQDFPDSLKHPSTLHCVLIVPKDFISEKGYYEKLI